MDFSPSERYLVTYSLTEPATPADKAVMNFNVFDVRSGRKLRNFTGNSDDFVVGAAGAGGLLGWPVFKWAGHPEDRWHPSRSGRTPRLLQTLIPAEARFSLAGGALCMPLSGVIQQAMLVLLELQICLQLGQTNTCSYSSI